VASGSSGYVRIGNRSRTAAIILAFFLGGIGAHKFYLGRTFVGLMYLIFFWTFIPAFAAFLDFILLVVMNDHDFDVKYNLQLAR
jgi:TM2 domain-containing membrane protein YozV